MMLNVLYSANHHSLNMNESVINAPVYMTDEQP